MSLLGRQPGVAAKQDQLPPGVGLGEVLFEDRPVRGRKVPEYFRNAAVLTRFGQLKRPIDCRCHASCRYHEPAAETNGSFRRIADITVIRQSIEMNICVAQVADDWIELQRAGGDEAPEDVFDRGWVLYNLVHDNPELAWETIKDVVGRYNEHDLSDDTTEGHKILSMTAAGPLEDLLAYHGPMFIEKVEEEAKRDARLAWTLRGVWQNAMSDDLWSRVRRAAGQTPD